MPNFLQKAARLVLVVATPMAVAQGGPGPGPVALSPPPPEALPWDSLDLSTVSASLVEVGGFVTIFIRKEEQTIGCWGYWQPNWDISDELIPCEPPETPDEKYVYITGNKHSCALRLNRTAVCWGGHSFQDAADPTAMRLEP